MLVFNARCFPVSMRGLLHCCYLLLPPVLEVAFQAFVAAAQNVEILGDKAKLSPSKQQQIASFRLVIPSIDDAMLFSKKLDAIWPSTSEHPCTQQI